LSGLAVQHRTLTWPGLRQEASAPGFPALARDPDHDQMKEHSFLTAMSSA
jgi:hypothetical protein